MCSKEILTLQFGHYANFVGTHWWNLQENNFDYNLINSTQPSEFDHGVLYREGITASGQLTFTPRLLLVDLKESLHNLPQEGNLYENNSSQQDSSDLFVNWHESKVDRKLEDPISEKNEFQRDLDDPKVLAEIPYKKYNLKDSVKVWSDFLYTRFHPRTVNIIKEYQYCNQDKPFESFTLGASLWKTHQFDEEFSDKMRNYVEECDQFQGFQLITDSTNGFAGLSASCLEYIRDEYDRKSCVIFPVIPSYFDDNSFQTKEAQVYSIMNDSARVVNLLLSFNSFKENGSMFVPICTGEDGWRQPGRSKKFNHLEYDPKVPYHSSAIIAAALDTATLKYRLKSSNFSLPDLCADLTGGGRKAVAASLSLPFSLNSDAEFITCLDQWDGPLTKSITPKCSIGSQYLMQHFVIRGVPENRLKKPQNCAGAQKDMQAYKYDSVKEMLEFYLSCTNYASVSNVTAVEKSMSTKNPFPDLFDAKIDDVNGNVCGTKRMDHLKVKSVPVMAGFHSCKEIGGMLESLHKEAAKLKIARFHQFAIDKDEYEENLNDILTLRENYDDSYLI